MPKIVITRTYNHRWPSRAVTCFEARDEPYTVKREVQKAAIAKGYGFDPEATNADAANTDQPAGELDGSDHGPDHAEPDLATNGNVYGAGSGDGAESGAGQ